MGTLSCELNTVAGLDWSKLRNFLKRRERAQVEAGPRWWSARETKGSKF